MDREYRVLDIRATGDRSIEGVIIAFDDEAVFGQARERFAPGSLEWSDVVLNSQLDRSAPLARTGGAGLEIAADNDRVSFTATLPAGARQDQALEDVRSGILRGASAEFVPLEEVYEDRVRIIKKATLVGLALVDRPAYSKSTIAAREAALQEHGNAHTKRMVRFYV